MGLLDGKVAVVTGGAQGIGLEIARTFIKEGATVVLGDINETVGTAAVAELGGESVARFASCDVRDSGQVEAMLDLAESAFGPVDVMVNNAGMTRDATMRKMTEQDFDDVIAVHLKGAWNGTRAAAARMRERETGAIVNISSISGKVGMLGQTNYSAAKAGMHGFTMALAQELASKGVTVNTVSPGYIGTDMVKAIRPDVLEKIVGTIPVKRLGEPSEIASIIAWLASEEGGYSTGADFSVNGGLHMH